MHRFLRKMYPRGALAISEENFRVMQPVLACSRAFGLCPVEFKNRGRFFAVRWSWACQVYSLLAPLALCVFTLVDIAYKRSEEVANEKDEKRRYLSVCDVLTIVFIVFCCVVTTPVKTKMLWKICELFNAVEKELVIKCPKKHRTASILSIAAVLLTYTIFYLIDLTWNLFYGKINAVFATPFYLLKYIMLNEILFFCHLVHFVKIRIRYLTKALRAIITRRIFDLSTFRNGEIAMLPPAQTNNDKINNTALRVFDLAKTYRKLHEAVSLLNGGEEITIVVILFCVMLHLIVSPYFLLTELTKNPAERSLSFVGLQFMWVMTHAGKFVIIMETCHYCTSEAEDLFNVAQNLFAEEKVEKTKKALFIFIQQLKMCKIELKVFGLFKLDRSVLTGFVAVITTYLVLLLQS
ncbi:unnamed protein product [Phyllotreta striolata]|uniref:Gustatory receptor n=1 Tax=Phyllotreta striolata TaxID=444603 RepID=A0A9N9TW47_PHYSR|nr:unnamed protein product [Phyllotreta striolata]